MASPQPSLDASSATQLRTNPKANYACPSCDKTFKRPSTLNEHIRATHTTERLICNTCGKALRRANDLKRHEKLHLGEKPFTCSASTAGGEVGCGKRFSRLHSLREHQRRRIGSTCWDAFVEAQTQSQSHAHPQSRATSPTSMSAYDETITRVAHYPDAATIHQSIERDAAMQLNQQSYKPIDWLNWSMQAPTPTVRPVSTPGRPQPIHPSDISWHSVLESRLRHDADSIIASSRNSSFSSNSSYPVSTSA
jgi:uncharacterized C2H2 Zn-finger protein